MKKNISLIVFSIFFFITGFKSSNFTGTSNNEDLTKFVNVFIGTGGHGHTYPGATTPFGLVQLSPDCETSGWDWCSGYHYSDSTIIGFSHTHLSGTGRGDLGDVLIMPYLGNLKLNAGTKGKPKEGYRARFSHADEKAEPGYYSVFLKDDKIKVELTATPSTGFHQYTFQKSDNVNIVIDLFSVINNYKISESEITVENDSTITGFRIVNGWSPIRNVYFAIKISKPFKNPIFYEGENKIIKNINFRKINGALKCFLSFKTSENEKIKIKVGISTVSKESAMMSLNKEIPDWNFEKIKKQAKELWNKELNKIKIEGSLKQKEIFYTAFYHTLVVPNQIADYNGQYTGSDNKVHQAKNGKYYSTFSLWDTYRAANPLYTIVEDDKVPDFINTMLDHFDQNNYLPMWPLWGGETNCMIGNHSIPVIVDAYLKGIKGFDVQKAYEAIKSSSTKNHTKSSWDIFFKYGYLPVDNDEQTVSKTLEMCYDDWCVAQMAKALGKTEDYNYFMYMSTFYKNLFDAKTGFMRGKNKLGEWKTPFNPFAIDWSSYTEANAWQYSFYVPQDVQEMIKIMGGNEKFVAKLDSLFTVNSKIEGESVDVSGLIGQYAHGNEPSHHIAYLFNYTDQPWKTQYYANKILTTQYRNEPDGYCGNEDCGQMSAWYILSSMGIYPVNPANGRYDLGSPILPKAEIILSNGNIFSVIAHNVNDKNIYIENVLLNGKPYDKGFITHNDILSGAKLEFFMTDKPNKNLIFNY